MTPKQSRGRFILGFIGSLLDTLIIFSLLISGVVLVGLGKLVVQVTSRFLLLGVGLGVQIVAAIFILIYAYLRFLRRSQPRTNNEE